VILIGYRAKNIAPMISRWWFQASDFKI